MSEREPLEETMPTYSNDALDVVLDEVKRARSLQSMRIDSLRSRAGVQIGASGIAAGLLSSLANSPVWMISVGAFLLAAIFGVLSILPRTTLIVQPSKVFEQAAGEEAAQVKVNVIAGIISEYQLQENKLAWPAIATRIATALFVVGIASVALVAAYLMLNPGPLVPIEV